MANMEVPEFLQNSDIDDIHAAILALIPDKYDKSEGQHYYNMTRGSAYIASLLIGYYLPEAIKLIWPQFSNDEYLELHAELRNLFRKEAIHATGEVTFTGVAGTIIPAGYIVSTESKNDIESKDYETIEQCVIGENGSVTVKAKASVAGENGKTAANTIVINTSSFDDITSVTNQSAFIGGVDEEDDETFYARIFDYDKTQGDSNVGNPADYKRWAEEVSGTGAAKVIRPKDTSGIVTIILTDGNGDPATETLCKAVYDHIMAPNDDNVRLAPCGAFLKVIPPTTTTITVRASVKITDGSIERITTTFVTKIKEYFNEALENKEILYNKICNILGDIPGVYDFSELYLNDKKVNIPLDDGVYPQISNENITLTLLE